YVTLVLEEWNDWPEFIRLQYFLESSTGGAVESSLTKRVFDESAGLYDHVWKLRAREMSQSFAATIRDRMAPYARQKWDAIDVQKPVDVSPTFTTFLTEVSRLLGFVNAEISPDSIMTLYILLNDQVWKAVEESVVNDNPFTGRGAAQVLFDVTSGLIPLLNTLFKRPKALGEFSAIRNMTCVAVLNSLRLLSLPAATAILLRSEVERIPEEMLEEKLKPFDVADVSKERVLELFKQRRDMSFSATSFR
ncbi:RAD50-interacting protein 1-like protein, partial [Aphelenchoides avenae]